MFNKENDPKLIWRKGEARDYGAQRRGIDTWSTRTNESVFMRFFYRLYKGFYVVFIFYYAPMIYLVLNQCHIMSIMTYDNRHMLTELEKHYSL